MYISPVLRVDVPAKAFCFLQKTPSYIFECIQVLCYGWTLLQGLFVFFKNMIRTDLNLNGPVCNPDLFKTMGMAEVRQNQSLNGQSQPRFTQEIVNRRFPRSVRPANGPKLLKSAKNCGPWTERSRAQAQATASTAS